MNKLAFKELIIDTEQKSCYIKNDLIQLTKHEFILLEFLLENKNKIFSRAELINNLWTNKVSLRTVDTVISRLKHKLREYSSYIKTKNGFGYGFII